MVSVCGGGKILNSRKKHEFSKIINSLAPRPDPTAQTALDKGAHGAMGGAARQHLPEPTGLWRVPGAHVDAVGGSPGALECT